MIILITVETLLTGGAETFSLRLAQALSKDNQVIIYRFYQDYIDQKIATQLAPNVELVSFSCKIDLLLRKVDSALNKVKLDFNIRNWFVKRDLQRLISKKKIEVIHSNQFKVDYVVTAIAANNRIPVVTTIHGDYLQFWHAPPASIPAYRQKLLQCVTLTNSIACISDVQLAFFRNQIQPLIPKKLSLAKIYNGYPFHPAMLTNGEESKSKLSIPEDSFIFGMVSRGIPDKGWEPAIQAFIALNALSMHLILVGDSPYLSELKGSYQAYQNIHFVGYAANPLAWISTFNVGLLPSVCASESLPTVVIEYLFCGKPVIASDIGEIANMLASNTPEAAGAVIPVVKNKVSVELLQKAMLRYLQEPDLFRIHAANTKSAAAKFDMQTCINLYMQLYKKNTAIS